jgi:hypothetical protein
LGRKGGGKREINRNKQLRNINRHTEKRMTRNRHTEGIAERQTPAEIHRVQTYRQSGSDKQGMKCTDDREASSQVG